MKWTHERRDFLFCELVNQFGKLDSWEKSHNPGFGRENRYKNFLTKFGNLIGTTSRAVELQIRFGSGVKNHATWKNHAFIGIFCLAAAHKAGFIKHSNIPYLEAYNPKEGEESRVAFERMKK